MIPETLIFTLMGLGVLATCALLFLDKQSVGVILALFRGHGELGQFQRVYLAAYLAAMMGDWLQGPFVYALYESYGFSRSDNASLFVAGFGSSAIFGTFIGSLADRHGRRKFALLYCVLYIVSCLTKHVNEFSVLMVGRITGGIATSLLFSVFEAWLVSEHNRRGFEGDALGGTFSVAFFGNGLIAIAAGEIGQAAADVLPLTPVAGSVHVGGYCSPFDVANVFISVCACLLVTTWSENYGHMGEKEKEGSGGFTTALRTMYTTPRVLECGIVSACFEASMYIFVFNWTPCLMEKDEPNPPFGHIFAAFMVMSMLGSRVFALASQSMRVERLGMLTLVVAAACHGAIMVTSSVIIRLIAFLAFEACVGVYFPTIGTMKGQIVPEATRSTVYNLYRVPLNSIVVITLVMKFDTATSFGITTSLLVAAVVAQMRLMTSAKGKPASQGHELTDVTTGQDSELEPVVFGSAANA